MSARHHHDLATASLAYYSHEEERQEEVPAQPVPLPDRLCLLLSSEQLLSQAPDARRSDDRLRPQPHHRSSAKDAMPADEMSPRRVEIPHDDGSCCEDKCCSCIDPSMSLCCCAFLLWTSTGGGLEDGGGLDQEQKTQRLQQGMPAEERERGEWPAHPADHKGPDEEQEDQSERLQSKTEHGQHRDSKRSMAGPRYPVTLRT